MGYRTCRSGSGSSTLLKKKLPLVIRAYQEKYLNAGPPHPPRKQESKKRPSCAAVSSTLVMHPAKSRLPAQRPHMQAEEILQPRDENEVRNDDTTSR
jgi:hypothetical protein